MTQRYMSVIIYMKKQLGNLTSLFYLNGLGTTMGSYINNIPSKVKTFNPLPLCLEVFWIQDPLLWCLFGHHPPLNIAIDTNSLWTNRKIYFSNSKIKINRNSKQEYAVSTRFWHRRSEKGHWKETSKKNLKTISRYSTQKTKRDLLEWKPQNNKQMYQRREDGIEWTKQQ